MQGYDAVAQETDVQVGGTDQLFNIIVAGRKLQEALGQKPLVGVIMGILPGTDGVQRMSKSMGNSVPINTGAEDMYGKLMSIPDFVMEKYMRLVTRWAPKEIDLILEASNSGKVHPRDVKMKLAYEIVDIFYGKSEATAAENAFIRVFQQKEFPEDMPEFSLYPGATVMDILIKSGLATSKSEAKRLLSQMGVRLDGEPLKQSDELFPHPGILQAGKRRFVRVK